MTEDEVEAVAAELAKAGGVGWYPGRERGPLKHVADRYRDRARLAIAALSRLRAGQQGADAADSIDSSPSEPAGTLAASSISCCMLCSISKGLVNSPNCRANQSKILPPLLVGPPDT